MIITALSYIGFINDGWVEKLSEEWIIDWWTEGSA
jgi:hypothetical protein